MSAAKRILRICNRRGLHARASAKFVALVEGFEADVRVGKDGIEVGGTSIMGLMMLGASLGSEIEVSATGPAAEEAIEAIGALVARRFDEDE